MEKARNQPKRGNARYTSPALRYENVFFASPGNSRKLKISRVKTGSLHSYPWPATSLTQALRKRYCGCCQ